MLAGRHSYHVYKLLSIKTLVTHNLTEKISLLFTAGRLLNRSRGAVDNDDGTLFHPVLDSRCLLRWSGPMSLPRLFLVVIRAVHAERS